MAERSVMLLKIIFLFVTFSSSSLALECQTPFVKALPASRFSATSNALKAPDVRFTTVPHWCPATADGENEYVTIDLQCARSVCQVEGKDENDNLLFYSGEYSKDGSTWKPLESDVETHYDSILKAFEANNKAVITPAISARFFRFRLPFWAGGAKPCIKVELYGETDSVESLGCFKERPKGPKSKKAMPVVYHSVKGVNPKSPDISAIYEECRQKADEYKKFQIEVFGIYNNGKCVTTASGKEDQYSRYGKSTKCSVCGEKGIGTKKGSTFVYKRQL